MSISVHPWFKFLFSPFLTPRLGVSAVKKRGATSLLRGERWRRFLQFHGAVEEAGDEAARGAKEPGEQK